MAGLTFDALLYPNHPYGRSVLGYEETVSSLGQSDLVRYYQNGYSPDGMVVAVVGLCRRRRWSKKVQASLGGWQAPGVTPNRSVPPEVELPEQRRQRAIVPGKTQSDLQLGWPAMARLHPDFMKANLANTVLGVFGMMGRLGDQLRDEEGWRTMCTVNWRRGWVQVRG